MTTFVDTLAFLAEAGLAFLAGAGLVLFTLRSALYSFVLPRGAPDVISVTMFRCLRWLFKVAAKRARAYVEVDRIMALFAPIAVLLLLPLWLLLTALGFTLMNWAVGVRGWEAAFTLSGSSLLTLGYASVTYLPVTILSFIEATLGLILIALLIAYLPVIYGAFTRRERELIMLEVRAGMPPSALEMLLRAHRINRLDKMTDLWETWEHWFTDVEESHTSLAAVAFFRSATADRSWIVAAGTIMDAAALMNSTLDVPRDSRADLCIRAGYMALRRISAYFNRTYPTNPTYPDDPISVSRAEWEQMRETLGEAGLPLKPDVEQAWRDFAGWRVNYDTVLLDMAEFLVAPPDVLWITDRTARDDGRLN